MRNNRDCKRTFAGMMVLCLCMAMVTPVVSFGAYAESGTVVEVLDENGQITEMGDGDAQVILEDPVLIEDDPVDEDSSVADTVPHAAERHVRRRDDMSDQRISQTLLWLAGRDNAHGYNETSTRPLMD